MRILRTLKTILACGLMLLFAQIHGGCNTGTGVVQPIGINITQIPQPAIRIVATVDAADLAASIRSVFDRPAGQTQQTITVQVPVGTNRTFTIQALNAQDLVLAQGTAGNVAVSQGTAQTLDIALQATPAPSPQPSASASPSSSPSASPSTAPTASPSSSPSASPSSSPTVAPTATPSPSPTPTPLPDLVVTSITFNPASPRVNQSLDIIVTVANQGNLAASNISVTLNHDGFDFTPLNIASLAAGASTTVTFQGTPQASNPNSNFTARADNPSLITESNESNNSRTEIVGIN